MIPTVPCLLNCDSYKSLISPHLMEGRIPTDLNLDQRFPQTMQQNRVKSPYDHDPLWVEGQSRNPLLK